MMAHGAATGSRWLHLRARTSALLKNARGKKTFRELCWQRAPAPRRPCRARLPEGRGPPRRGGTRRRIEPQAGIAPHDQQQLVEGRDAGGELGAVAKLPAAIDDPADSLGAQRLFRRFRTNHVADSINARDANRPKSPLGLAELMTQEPVPALR